jgi:epoxyqueuosine reductase
LASYNTLKNIHLNTELIKFEAKAIGFSDCGISAPSIHLKDLDHLRRWLKDGMNGEMDYLEKNSEKRLDPKLIYPETRSIVSVILSYNTDEKQKSFPFFKISKYAFYEDYHKVIKTKLRKLLNFIKNNIEGADGRYFVDSAPVFERAVAKNSGLGWIGKNACLVSKEHGSFVYIGELFLNIELNYGKEAVNLCGDCDKCIKSCPAGAIIKPHVIDATKCISYYTITHKSEIPARFKGKFNDYIYGCDICQDVCPWNIKTRRKNTELKLNRKLLDLTEKEWKEFSPGMFDKISESSALKEKTYERIKRNIDFLISDF